MTYIYALILEFTSGAKVEVRLFTEMGPAADMADLINTSPAMVEANKILGIRRAYTAQRAVEDGKSS